MGKASPRFFLNFGYLHILRFCIAYRESVDFGNFDIQELLQNFLQEAGYQAAVVYIIA